MESPISKPLRGRAEWGQTTVTRVSDERSFVELQPNGGKWRNRTPEALRPYCFRDSSLDHPDTSHLVAPARIELAHRVCNTHALPLCYGAMVPLERFELPTPRFEAWRSDSAELQGHILVDLYGHCSNFLQPACSTTKETPWLGQSAQAGR